MKKILAFLVLLIMCTLGINAQDTNYFDCEYDSIYYDSDYNALCNKMDSQRIRYENFRNEREHDKSMVLEIMTVFIIMLVLIANTFVAFIIGGIIIYRLAKAKGLKNVSRGDCIWTTWWASPIMATLYYGLMPNGTDLKSTKTIKESTKTL